MGPTFAAFSEMSMFSVGEFRLSKRDLIYIKDWYFRIGPRLRTFLRSVVFALAFEVCSGGIEE